MASPNIHRLSDDLGVAEDRQGIVFYDMRGYTPQRITSLTTDETTTIRIARSTRERLDPHLQLFTQDSFVLCMLNLWESASEKQINDAMTKTARDRLDSRQAQAKEGG